MVGPTERLAHVAELLPEICTLDCGTMNFSLGDYVMTNTPATLRAMAEQVQALGVRPELEVFDAGHLVFVHDLIKEGLIDDPAMIQLCMGIPYGAPDDPLTFMAHGQPAADRMRCSPPSRSAATSCPSWPWRRSPAATCGSGSRTTCSSARACSPAMASSSTRAKTILEAMGARVLGPADVREKLEPVGSTDA